MPISGGGGNKPNDLSFDWNPISWWDSWFNGVSNWLGGLGGDIASGIETGIVAILKDLWGVILPYAEIGFGMVIAFWAIAIWLMSTNAGQAAISTGIRAAMV